MAYLVYNGSTQATAGLYQGERVIATTIRYSRAGRNLNSATSRANGSGSHWYSGPVASVRVYDNLSLNGAKTEWSYSYSAVPPNVLFSTPTLIL